MKFLSNLNSLTNTEDILATNPQLSRRSFLQLSGGAAFIGLFPNVANAQEITNGELDIEQLNSLIAPGSSEYLGWDTPQADYLRAVVGKFYSETEVPLFKSIMPVFNFSGQNVSIGHGFVLEQDQKLNMVIVDHVARTPLYTNAGQYFTLLPRTGFYKVRPDRWNLTPSYRNDTNDGGYAFHSLTSNPNDRLGVHLRYQISRSVVEPFSGVSWRLPEKDEKVGIYRPDQDNLLIFEALPYGQFADTELQNYYTGRAVERGSDLSNGINVNYFKDTQDRNVVCGGISGTPFIELYQDTLTPTGNVFLGALSHAPFHDGTYEADFFNNLGDARGCEPYAATRPLSGGRLVSSDVVKSRDLERNPDLIRDLLQHRIESEWKEEDR